MKIITKQNKEKLLINIPYGKLYKTKKQLVHQDTIHDCLIVKVGEYIVYMSDDGRIEYDNVVVANVYEPVIDVHDKVTIIIN